MSDKQLPDGIEWPRYDDGEPLGIGDCFLTPILHAKAQVKSIAFKGMCATIETDRGAHCKFGVGCRVMRPPVLDKDGIEIKVGDTVYNVVSGEGSEVKAIEWDRVGAIIRTTTSNYFGPSDLTHTPPDSWEKLREDSLLGSIDYWGCGSVNCDYCTAVVDGETPLERYNVECCDDAMRLDLIARAEKLAGVMGDE